MKRETPIEVTHQERAWGKSLAEASGTECPPTSYLIQFVQAKGSKSAKDAVLCHLGHCRSCRAVILELRAAEAAQKRTFPFFRNLGWSRTTFTGVAATLVLVVAGASYWRLASHADKTGSSGMIAREKGYGLVVKTGGNTLIYKPLKPLTAQQKQDLMAMNSDSGSSESGVRAMKLCLVLGSSHVYKVDPKDAHRDQRKKIEQDYADGVAAKRDKYSHSLKPGADRALAERELKRDLEKLAAERERRLGELYPTADDLKVKHPELDVENCGPCPVVEFSAREDGVPDPNEDFVVEEPWPGYQPGDSAYGWTYGRHYRPDDFQDQYQRWQASHLGSGRPAFYGLQGKNGPVEADQIRRTDTGSYHIHLSDPTTEKSFTRTGGAAIARAASPQVSRYADQNRAFGRPSREPSKYSHSLGGNQDELFSAIGSRPVAGDTSGQPSRYSHTLSGSHYSPKRPQPESGSSETGPSKYLRGQSGG